MPGQRLGSMIAASFGLVYVVVNTGSFPVAVATSLRVLGVAAFVAIVVAVVRSRPAGAGGGERVAGFGRAYWAVVGAEVVALFAGLRVLDAAFDLSYAGVGWVSVVVGIHFLPLARIWREPVFVVLGVLVAGCGAIALLLAATLGDVAAVPAVGGVLPGFILLASGWWGARRARRDETAPDPGHRLAQN